MNALIERFKLLFTQQVRVFFFWVDRSSAFQRLKSSACDTECTWKRSTWEWRHYVCWWLIKPLSLAGWDITGTRALDTIYNRHLYMLCRGLGVNLEVPETITDSPPNTAYRLQAEPFCSRISSLLLNLVKTHSWLWESSIIKGGFLSTGPSPGNFLKAAQIKK
jgi:hypothetical protein